MVSLSFCMSLMFPTIYGVALHGLGPATKFGAAGLVMAIVDGAIVPLVQVALLDATSPPVSFLVPAVCFAVVGILFDAFKSADPGVRVESAAIRGGAGSNVQIALAKRLRDDDPPDVWQTFPGSSLRANARSGRIAAVTATFEQDKLADAIPAPVLDALTWDGQRWGVPTGAHRQNMLWFNPAVLKKAGVALPASGYAATAFAADLAALRPTT